MLQDTGASAAPIQPLAFERRLELIQLVLCVEELAGVE
jgi:hypothetical protein